MNKMDINLFHNITHFSENYLKGTANRIGITFTGKLKECIHCARSKAKRTKLKKTMPNTASYPGERIAIDVSSTKKWSYKGNFHVFAKIDEFSGILWCSFHKKKSDIIMEGMNFVKYL